MNIVTKEKFYEIIGKRDVHPCPAGMWDDELGYTTLWKTRSGNVIAESNFKEYKISGSTE